MDLLRLQDVEPEPESAAPDRDTIGLHLSDEDPGALAEPEPKGLRREFPWLLVSVGLHALIMVLATFLNIRRALPVVPVTSAQRASAERIYLPSRARLQQLVPAPQRKAWHEAPT